MRWRKDRKLHKFGDRTKRGNGGVGPVGVMVASVVTGPKEVMVVLDRQCKLNDSID